MINGNNIQLFSNDTTRSDVLKYNGLCLDEYCTYCTIKEELYEDNFSLEMDLRLPKLSEQTEVKKEVVEVKKEYAITQNTFTNIRLLKQPNNWEESIALEENVRLEILEKGEAWSKVLYNNTEWFIDNNNLANYEVIQEDIKVGEKTFTYTNSEYSVNRYNSNLTPNGTFSPNTRVELLTSDKANYFKVKHNNVEYYIKEIETIAVPTSSTTYVTTLEVVKAYREKDTTTTPLYTIPKNTKVEFVDEYLNWMRVKYNGTIGFVEKVITERISLGFFGTVSANGGLNLRQEPATSSTILVVIPQNTVIKVLENANGWVKTTYNGKTGYCYSSYVSNIYEDFLEDEIQQFGPKTTEEKNENIFINTLREIREKEDVFETIRHEFAYTKIKVWEAIIYSDSDYSSSIITILNPGIKVRVLSQGDSIFTKIQYNNITGYIENDKLTNFSTEITFETIILEQDKEKDLRSQLKFGSVLKVRDEYGFEIFRITNIISNDNVQTIYARQITLEDSLRLWIEDSRPTVINGAGALEKLYIDSVGKIKEIQTFSDIADTNTTYVIDKTFYEALHDDDNGFLSRWGGEIERRGYKLSILKKRGSDRNVTFRRGKNYTGIEEDVDLDNLITRIIPVGFDGIQLEEKYVDSPKINDYYNIFPKEIKFEDVKYKYSSNNTNQEGFETLNEAREELKKRAREYFLTELCDEVKGTYSIKVVDITKTEEYKDLSIFETTWIGDTVKIIDEKLGINFSSRLVSRQYDVIGQKRKETKISNVVKKVTSLTLEELAEKIENIQFPEISIPELPGINDVIQEVVDIVEEYIKLGSFGGHVVLKENEILIMDTNDVNTARQGLVLNKNGLAGFTNGYYGSFNTAITIDGQIVADAVTVGKLNANLIKVGTLMSANGKSWLNMENGSFNWGNKLVFDGNNLTINMNNGKTLDSAINEIKDNTLEAKIMANEAKITAEGFESRITSLDTDLTKKINEIKATADGLVISVSKNGGDNLLSNSSFETRRFVNFRSVGANVKTAMVTQAVHEIRAQEVNGSFLYLDTNEGWCDVGTNLYFECETNTNYTISFDSRFATNGQLTQSVCYLVNEDKTKEYRIAENLRFDYNWNRQSFVFNSGSISGKLYLKLGFYGTAYSWGCFDNVKIAKGTVETHGVKITEWTPSPNEIFQSTTVINEEGITVYGHDLTSATFAHDGVKFRDNKGMEGIAIDNGGIEVIDTNTGEFIGFIKSSNKKGYPNQNGICFSSAGSGDYLALGTCHAERGTGFVSDEAIGIFRWKLQGQYEPGIHFWQMPNSESYINSYVYNHTHYEQTNGNMYIPSTLYFDKIQDVNNDSSWVGKVKNASGAIGIFGDNEVRIGTKVSSTSYNQIVIAEDTSSAKANINFYAPLNMNGWAITNQRSMYSMINSQTSRVIEEFNLTSNSNSTRYVFKKMESKDKKIVINIPNKYKYNPYTITSIVKYGKGDVWISEEEEGRFTLECDNDMKVNVEIEIELNDEIVTFANTRASNNTSTPLDDIPTVASDLNLS